MTEFDPDEITILKKMIEREKAVSWMWGWLVNVFLVGCGGIITVMTILNLMEKR